MEPVEKRRALLAGLTSQSGFTLHETLVAMAFISAGVLGFALSTNGVIRGNSLSSNVTVATHLAEDKVEELKARDSLDNGDNCSGAAADDNASDQKISATGANGGIYQRCWSITDSPLGIGLKRIDVTVSWPDSAGKSVTLSTLVYKE